MSRSLSLDAMAKDSAEVPAVYTQEQVQQILNVAIARQTYDGEFSRDQLLEIADELGISKSCLLSAEETWLSQRTETEARLAFDQYRQGQLKKKLERCGYASGTLVVLNALTGFAWPWSVYLICLMGLKLGFDAWTIYNQNREDYEQDFRRWTRKRHLSQFVNRWWTRIFSV